MTNIENYKEHHKIFEQNVAFAARNIHYLLHISDRAKEDEAVFKALNKNARFWNDYNFNVIQTVIVFLGKIFDEDSRTYNISRTLNLAKRNLNFFSKQSLRDRKIASAGEFEGLDEYVDGAHELSSEDIKTIKKAAKEARRLWENFKPLRDKFYAHSEILSQEDKEQLLQQAKYDDLRQIIQILLNITHAFEQAELNGRKPDLTQDYEGTIRYAQGEADRLIDTLIAGK